MMKLFLLLLFAVGLSAAQAPLTECRFARATIYSVHRVDGVPYGTCGYGPVASSMASIFRNGYITAPDDETYNGYPDLSPPITITTGGVGKSCGECFELTGPLGTITVMNSDVCDTGCCDNCQGSLGGDVQAFDVDSSQWEKIVNQSGGHVVVSYRKVACPLDGKPVSLFFSNEGTPQPTYFRLRVINHRVGLQSVEVKGSASGATQGQWVFLQRGWEGYFNWTGRGDIGLPFSIRVTSIYNETITWSQTFDAAAMTALTVHSSGKQFTAPATAFPTAVCEWAGPPPTIYDDKLHGLVVGNLLWRYWGGPVVDYASTVSPHSGSYCINLGKLASWALVQIGYQTIFPSSWFTGFSFWARTSGEEAYDKLQVYWKCNSREGTETTSKIPLGSLTSTWKFFNISFSEFTTLPVNINVLQFQNAMNSEAPVSIFLDDIQLLGHTPAVTPDLPSDGGGGGTGTSSGVNAATTMAASAAAVFVSALVSAV